MNTLETVITYTVRVGAVGLFTYLAAYAMASFAAWISAIHDRNNQRTEIEFYDDPQ